jgi:hypothetical protein
MGQVIRGTFEPAHRAGRVRAFARAWREIETIGLTGMAEQPVRIAAARAIQEAAQHGVTGETALADYAVLHFRLARAVAL